MNIPTISKYRYSSPEIKEYFNISSPIARTAAQIDITIKAISNIAIIITLI